MITQNHLSLDVAALVYERAVKESLGRERRSENRFLRTLTKRITRQASVERASEYVLDELESTRAVLAEGRVLPSTRRHFARVAELLHHWLRNEGRIVIDR